MNLVLHMPNGETRNVGEAMFYHGTDGGWDVTLYSKVFEEYLTDVLQPFPEGTKARVHMQLAFEPL